ncbi:MAG: Gfo/Idh/MocA family oxidoreductase, partial [Candidatus Pacebacteria bacterium]|nr:Gfo/Idh/MocA family oxidoreductase [Candidatus Paceibacterota bacterium]
MQSHPVAYSRATVADPRFKYLDDEDRYFFKTVEPCCNLAVIGCGINGLGHIRSAAAEGRGRITGLFDTHARSIDAARGLCAELTPDIAPTVYPSLDAAVADTVVDGFIICTPNHTHHQVLEYVLTAGKPVYLEKPMAATLSDTAAIVRLIREHDVPMQVGLQYRYKATTREALDTIQRRRAVGNLKTIAMREHRGPFLDKVGQWNKYSKYSGGTLVEKCCHYFDLFNLMAESLPVRVFASGSQAAAYPGFEYDGKPADILDNAAVIVEYENEIRANFDLCMFSPTAFEELVVCGDGGRLRMFEQQDATAVDGVRTGLEVHRGEMYPAYTSRPVYTGVARTLGHSGADFFSQHLFVDLVTGNDTSV